MRMKKLTCLHLYNCRVPHHPGTSGGAAPPPTRHPQEVAGGGAGSKAVPLPREEEILSPEAQSAQLIPRKMRAEPCRSISLPSVQKILVGMYSYLNIGLGYPIALTKSACENVYGNNAQRGKQSVKLDLPVVITTENDVTALKNSTKEHGETENGNLPT